MRVLLSRDVSTTNHLINLIWAAVANSAASAIRYSPRPPPVDGRRRLKMPLKRVVHSSQLPRYHFDHSTCRYSQVGRSPAHVVMTGCRMVFVVSRRHPGRHRCRHGKFVLCFTGRNVSDIRHHKNERAQPDATSVIVCSGGDCRLLIVAKLDFCAALMSTPLAPLSGHTECTSSFSLSLTQ